MLIALTALVMILVLVLLVGVSRIHLPEEEEDNPGYCTTDTDVSQDESDWHMDAERIATEERIDRADLRRFKED